MRIRMLQRRLTMCLAAGVVAGTGALVGAPIHAHAASTVTLTASSSTANAGDSVTFTATASPTPAPDYELRTYETTTFDSAGFCHDTNPCVGSVVYPVAGSHTFVAQLTDNTNTVWRSNPVTVTWVGTATYTLTLTASTTQAQAGETVSLTATPSPNMPTGYFIDIYDLSTTPPTRVGLCYLSSYCVTDVSYESGTHSFQAYLDTNDTTFPPTGTIAESDVVSVHWATQSELLCQPPTLPILSGGLAGFNLLLAARASGSQVIVCFREDDAGTTAIGGAVIVTTSVPGVPHPVPANLCAGAAGNTVPGPHPYANVSVLGVTTFVDVYQGPAAGSDTWVCVAVGSTGETVVIPSLSGIPSVQFVPDDDSIIK